MTDERPPADDGGDGDDPRAGGEAGDAGTAADAPVDGQVLLLAAAKASVAPDRLPALVERAATGLRERRERYRRDYERVHADADREVYLVEGGHWADLGETFGFTARERDAVGRVHEEQLRRIGRRTGRRAEFDHALEIREAVVVGRSDVPADGDQNGQR